MSFVDSALDFLKNLSTDNILAYLGHSELGNLIHNPVFLVAMGILAILGVILKKRILLGGVITLVGIAGLMNYMGQHGTDLEGGMTDETMLIFIGVGVAIIGSLIYLLFIKSD